MSIKNNILAFFYLHCLATKPKWNVKKGDIEAMHKGPKDLDDGRVKYLGKTYASREELPKDTINNKPIAELHGRGWDRCGYAIMIKRNGQIVLITPYDDDDIIEADEMTWGVAGENSQSRHIALEGGYGAKETDDFFDHFTAEQYLALLNYLKVELAKHPNVKVKGHNESSLKACPGFHVNLLLETFNLQKYGT